MNWKRLLNQVSVLGVITWSLAGISITESAIAQTTLTIEQPSTWLALDYNPPNRGGPGSTRNGGQRTGCEKFQKPLIALNPSRTNWGETIEAHPTFWLYLPNATGVVEMVLLDENDKSIVYKTHFQVKGKRGIGRFALPTSAPALNVNRLYRWQFSWFCNPKSSQSHFLVNGIVVRRTPSTALTQKLNDASPPQRAVLFAENGLWYDALKELADLRSKRPQDQTLLKYWKQLLQDPVVKLDDIVDEPLSDCCQLAKHLSES